MTNSSDPIRSVLSCWTYYAHIIVEVSEVPFEVLSKCDVSVEVCELCRKPCIPIVQTKYTERWVKPSVGSVNARESMLVKSHSDVVQVVHKVMVLVLLCTRECTLTSLAPKDQDFSSWISSLLVHGYNSGRCGMLSDSMDSEIVPARKSSSIIIADILSG